MDRVLVVVQHINGGGVATAVNNFFLACSRNFEKIKFDVLCFNPPSKKVQEVYNKYNAKIHVMSRFRESGLSGYYKAIYECIKNNGPYKAIHIHTAYFIWIAARAAEKLGIPIRVGHAHGYKSALPWFIRFWYLPISRLLNRRYCTHMLACAEKSGKHTFGRKCVFLPNIFPENNPLKSTGVLKLADYPQETLKLAYIGGIEYRQKNVGFLVPLMRKLVKKCKAILLIAGNGTCVQRLKKQIVKYHLEESIIFLGYVQNTQQLLANIDFLVMPSYNEGMSLTLLEAQLAGVPCVVSKGIPKTNNIQLEKFHQMNNWNAEKWAFFINSKKNEKHICMTMEEKQKALKALAYDSYTVAKKLVEIYSL